MKKWRVENVIFTIIAVLTTVYLTFFNPIEKNGEIPKSWSDNAVFATAFLLNLALIAIAKTFSTIATSHPLKDLEIYKWFSVSIRLKNLARFTEYGFYAVLVAHLGNEYLPDVFHFIATGLAVTGLYLMIAGWFKTGTAPWFWYLFFISLSALGLILAVIFHWWEVKYPEFALLIVGLVFIQKITKK